MRAYVGRVERQLPSGFEEFTARQDAAVVSVDMHEGHLSDSPDCPCPAPRGRAIVEAVDAFHREARAMGVPIIHVKSVLRKSGIDDIAGIKSAWRLLYDLNGTTIPNIDEHAIEGTRWTNFVTEVRPEDHTVETKRRLSIFYPTDLDFLLRNMGVKRLVLNGGMTDCCILNAAFDAANRNYRVVVARDLVAGSNQALEDAALEIVSLHLGLVADSHEILKAWSDERR
jgi:nicotinamidase-related amidase